MLLFLGSDVSLPLQPWEPTQPAFHVDELERGSGSPSVRAHLTGPHVYELGSAEKCACAYAQLEELSEDERVVRVDAVQKLRDLLIEAIRRGATVELFACRAGREADPPTERRPLSIEDVTPERFLVCEGALLSLSSSQVGESAPERPPVEALLELLGSPSELEAAAGRLASTALQSLALHLAALSRFAEGDSDGARRTLEQAAVLEKSSGHRQLALQTSHQSELMTHHGSDIERSIAYYLETLTTVRRLRNIQGIALTARSLGEVLLWKGDRARAVMLWQASVDAFRKLRLQDAEGVEEWLAGLGGRDDDSALPR